MSILDLAHQLLHVPRPEAKKPVFGTGNFKKKVVSMGLAVHPDQIPEARALAKAKGVVVPDFNEHGEPTFDNSRNFRDYCRAMGKRHKGYV